MMTCSQARLLLKYGATPGTTRTGFPELGFHLAGCSACRAIWERATRPSAEPAHPSDSPSPELTYADTTVGFGRDNGVLRLIARDLPRTDCSPPQPRLDHDPQPAVVAVDVIAEPSAQPSDAQTHRDPESKEHARGTVTYVGLLRNPNYRRLWLGHTISTFGSQFTRIAVPIYVLSLTNSYWQLGFSFFASLIAPVTFGLFAGALVDRWDRRRTMIAADVGNALLLLGLLAVVVMPAALPIKLGAIYAVNFGAALLRELFNPARVAIFPDVLAEEELLVANSLDQATTTFGELLSYPLAAAGVLYLGPLAVFGVDALSFLASALVLAGLRTRSAPATGNETRDIWGEIRAGLRAANELPTVREIVGLSLIVPLLLSLLNTLQAPFAKDVLGSTAEIGFPALEGAFALGVIIGMLLLGRLGQRVPRSGLLSYGIGSAGVAILILGLLPSLVNLAGLADIARQGAPWTLLLLLALPVMMLGGAANSMILVSIRTVMQEQTPRALLGRVASVVGAAAGIGFASGALLTGFGQNHTPLVFTLIGFLLCGLGLLCCWWLPRRRRPAPHPLLHSAS